MSKQFRPQPKIKTTGDVKMVDVKSSNIDKVGYIPETKVLHVLFKNGGHYAYHGVDPELHEQLMKAPSVGSFIHNNIKGRHETKKIS